MSNPGILFKRYSWLISTIRNAPGYFNREDVLELYGRQIHLGKTGKAVSAKTFHNHVNAIKEIFGIEIICSKSTGRYYIKEDPDKKGSGVLDWLLESISVNNSIQKSEKLHNRIHFEQIPSGNEFLQTIIDAMDENRVLSVTHKKFDAKEPKEYFLEPWALKIFKQRWYVLARNIELNTQNLYFYALDRIEKIDLSDKTFIYPEDFDIDVYVSDFYGLTLTKDKPINIKISVDSDQVKYFRTLPLHRRQKDN